MMANCRSLVKRHAELGHQGDLEDRDIETTCMFQLLCSVELK